ncbi:PHB depolymerase family esterase [Nocardioides turkmenicus]|uniref:extracellular catalytic domain type 1 short-chain-length polyhydroxyalkanoate depolymerase n=1 Tax=Nocardioides turkmenicus TaxID=2711220 RepID=UPI0019CF9081|nr:PHB depolymerase family esterase [Nocardioides sp. KC13]
MRLGSSLRLVRNRGGAALAALGLVVAGGAAVAVAPSAGSTAAAAAGTWTARTAGGMTTQLYVPSSAPMLGTGRALMVNLHGCVQTSANLRDGGNWTATADARGMVVAIPAAPNGGVLLGCWDYYDSNHSRTSPGRHDDNLLQLVRDLLADPALDIDPDQVYLSGLSSGGGETMVMGCLAPDVFAGIGINAGPSVGTTSSQIGSVAVTQSQVTNTCRTFAGSSSSGFGSQLTSVVYGSNDTTVAPGYNTLNAQVMAGIYGASSQSSFSLAGLAGNNTAGSGTLWSDGTGPRVSLIQNTGMGHNWPAGAARAARTSRRTRSTTRRTSPTSSSTTTAGSSGARGRRTRRQRSPPTRRPIPASTAVRRPTPSTRQPDAPTRTAPTPTTRSTPTSPRTTWARATPP